MKRHTFIAVLVLLFTAVGCSKEPTRPAEEQKLWPRSTPEAQGMDAATLDSAFAEAEAAGFVDCLLLVRNGYLIAEDYYNGFAADKPHNVMSVSKSFLSAITGQAFADGNLDSLNERVLDFFPEYLSPELDSAKHEITIEHLLTMRMGLRREADDNYAEYWRLYNSANWIKATIESPLLYQPGERMSYNTFQTHLLSGVITKATGQSTKAYATSRLLAPMGIDVDAWEQDPQGYYFGGNSMQFTPREMALLGWLYLKEGRLGDTQIVASDWVEFTLSPSTDLAQPNAWGELKNYNYAYLWWLGEVGGQAIFMALGYGGQFVVVFPELQLVVVTTAHNEVLPETAESQELALLQIIARYIVPAASR